MVATVRGSMAFTQESDVSNDHERTGLKRAATKDFTANLKEQFDYRFCDFQDCLAPEAPKLNIKTLGFDTIDLSKSVALQRTLEEVRVAGRVNAKQGHNIRQLIKQQSYKLSNGETLRFLYVASEGFIVRKAGPNGLVPQPEEVVKGSNGHQGAMNVHGDQDVYGTPIKQILKGFGPMLFNHKTPDGENHISPFFLINLWIPLQQITRPLTLMDRRTLNNREHQLRYALPTDSFLERNKEQVNNDIWTFLHHDTQDWYFHSEMNANKAYVFDTLGEPHSAFILPGEQRAEQLYKQIEASILAVKLKSEGGIQDASRVEPYELPDDTTEPLRAAITNMEILLNDAHKRSKSLCVESALWQEKAEQALDKVVRKSLEMRVVGLITPF